jgi:hypothetical protein
MAHLKALDDAGVPHSISIPASVGSKRYLMLVPNSDEVVEFIKGAGMAIARRQIRDVDEGEPYPKVHHIMPGDKAVFTLEDENGKEVAVVLTVGQYTAWLALEGYGWAINPLENSFDVVGLDVFHSGDPAVLVWTDAEDDEYTHRITLEKARYQPEASDEEVTS